MNAEQFTLEVSDAIGAVSAELVSPNKPKAVMTLAHGAGAPMTHPFMVKLAHEFARADIATIRFNFPYIEKGKSRPDLPHVAHKAVYAALQKAHDYYPGLPVIASGKSFGGRMSSQLLSKENLPFVKAIIFYGFPLHPPGNPGIERADHLHDVKVPMLFLQGTKDTLAKIELVEKVCQSLSNATLVKFENADHSFKQGKKDAIVDLSKKSSDWLSASNIL